jgi:hypothetical protein
MCCSKQGMNYVHGFCNLVFENMQIDNLLIVILQYKKKKSITEKYWDWELANDTKPIWVCIFVLQS